MSTRLSRAAIRHPTFVLLLAAVLMAVTAPGLLRLELRTDGRALVPQDAPEVQLDREVRAAYGINDPAVVLVDAQVPGGIYNAQALRLVQRLSRRIQDMPEIGALNVSSLDNEPSDRFIPRTFNFYPLLEPFPERPEDLRRLRGEVESNGLYVGTIAAADGSAATILFGVPETVDRLALSTKLWSIVDEELGAWRASSPLPAALPKLRAQVIGAPFAETLLGNHILQDLGIPDQLLGSRLLEGEHDRADGERGWFALRRWVAGHVGLLPIAIAVMAVVFLVGFRSLAAMSLPFLQVVGCLLFVFGVMGYAGVPVYLTTAVLPIILTSIGVADEIHILGRYRQRLAVDAPGRDTLIDTMEEMSGPVVRTSVTTAIGFLSFALSAIVPVRTFGIFASLGILFCMFWSLSVTPAILAVLPPRWLTSAKAPPSRQSSLRRLTLWSLGHRRQVMTGIILLLGLGVLGLLRVRVQDSWIDGFDPQSALYRATQNFNAHFFGPHVLQVQLDAGHDTLSVEIPEAAARNRRFALPVRWTQEPARLEQAEIRVTVPDSTHFRWDVLGNSARWWTAVVESVEVQGDSLILTTPIRAGLPHVLLRLAGGERLRVELETRRLETPMGLRHVRDLEDFIKQQGRFAVGGVLGPADYIETTSFIMGRRHAAARQIPADPFQVKVLWQQYGRVRGEHSVHRVVDEARTRCLITVFLKNANYRDTRSLMQALRDYERRHLQPLGMQLSFAGDVAVSQALIAAIVRTQVQSLLASLVGILLVSVVFTRSLRRGVFVVVPCAAAVLLNFAYMGWTGMPLGVATSMFAGMILGIGVDFAIHLLERYRRERDAGKDVDEALAEAAAIAGPPILIDGAAIALGFGVLTLSQVPANARLGALAALCIATCLLGTLLWLPLLIRTWSAGRPVSNQHHQANQA